MEEENNSKTQARFLAIKRLFLEVKFSKKDQERLQKRIDNTNIKRVHTEVIKGKRQALSQTEYKDQIKHLSQDQRLISQENYDNLLRLCCDEDDDSHNSILEEVSPNSRLFGYVAVAKSLEGAEGLFDVIHVMCRGECEYKTYCCGCFTSSKQKNPKQRAYTDALVLSYLRIKVIEHLRIEGLTTRGQHHRNERFHARKTSQVSTENEASVEEE